jgi:hypothetical protein
MPLRRIHVTITSQPICFDLDELERLGDRRAAEQLMRRVKPLADRIITSTPPAPSLVQYSFPTLAPGTMSIDYMPIIALEEMNTPKVVSSVSTCVSFVEGTFVDDQRSSQL